MFQDNQELGRVQENWGFMYKGDNLQTWLSEINLYFQFEEKQMNDVYICNVPFFKSKFSFLEDNNSFQKHSSIDKETHNLINMKT